MRYLKKISIQYKIIIIIVFVNVVATLIGTMINLYSDQNELRQKTTNDAKLNAQFIGEYLTAPLDFADMKKAQENLDKLIRISSIEVAIVYTKEGVLFAKYFLNNVYQKSPSYRISEAWFEGNDYHIFEPIVYKNNYLGTLYLKINTNIDQDMLSKIRFNFALSSGIVLITIILGGLFQRLITHPVIRLSNLTAQISDKQDFGQRIKNTREDEIGTLYHNFNFMLDVIHHREMERDKALESLAESEERFKKIAETANDAIIIIDDDGKIRFWNHAAEKTFGYTGDEILGKELHLNLAAPQYQKPAQTGIERFKKTGEGFVIGKSVEFEGIRKSGEIFPFELSLASFYIKNKWYAVGILRDTTERKKDELLIKETNQNLEEMVYIASHDLRSPLVSIEGYATELLETYKDKLDQEGIYCLTRLKANANRMHKLIVSLLDLSRLNTQKMQHEEFGVSELIEKICKDLALVIEKEKVTIICNTLPSLIADKLRIETVFRNLIANAINYNGKKILIGFENNTFYIQDDGIGIPIEQLEKIFKPGERLQLIKSEGVGMGLTFCRKVIQQYNGTIWAKSSGLNQGACFYFNLAKKYIK
jgi:PAS domain S-box-containing protein